MTKEELEKEAREDIDSLNGIDLVSSTMIAIDKYGAYKLGRYDGYLASAEPREKQIADLEEKLANADYQLEGRDNEIRELKTDYEVLSCSVGDFGELQDKLEEEQRKNNRLSDNLTRAKEIIKIARDAYIKSGVHMLNSEPVYGEEVDRLYDLFFDKSEQFLNEVKND